MEKKIKVMIAEDIAPIRKRYVSVLSKSEDISVISDVDTAAQAYEDVKKNCPDVVLMDIEMETKDAGIQATGKILAEFPHVRIIILTVYEEDELIFSAFRLGACDYMLKNASDEEIITAVKQAYEGKSPIRPEIAGKIRSEFQRVKTYESSFLYMVNLLSTLTSTELDTLYLISSGYTRKEICKIRCVEMSTVKSQIHHILKKFGKKKISEVIQNETDRKLLESIMKYQK